MNTLHFRMTRYDDDGVYYVITGIEEFIVTEGATIEDALRHLREAVELHFEDDPGMPKLEVIFEVTTDYA